ncbi:MAG: hypothetical protein ABI969_14940 [bacterium]
MPISMRSQRLRVGRNAVLRVLGAFVLAILSSCDGCEESAGSLATGEEFVVLPRIVHVQAPGPRMTSSLRLEVVSRGIVGNPTDPSPLTWTATKPGVTFVSSGASTIMTLTALPAGEWFSVTARNGGRAATSIIVVDLASSQPWDEVRDDVANGENPSAALLTGTLGDGCAYDRVEAFSGGGGIGQLTSAAPCARTDVAIFSVTGRPLITRPVAWTAVQDIVDATGNGGPIGIPIQLVIGVPVADANNAALDEANFLLSASDTYRNMRTGIELPPSLQTTISQALPPTFTKCANIPTLPAAVAPNPTKLNIYHISVVEDGAGTRQRGFFCTPNVILMGHGWALQTTLGHELGHALGLMAPSFGHTDNVAGFIRDNVMSTDAALGQDARFRFSLGQLYRMHIDGRSWLRRNPDLSPGAFTCGCDPYARLVCPALPTDLRPIIGAMPAPGGSCM